MKSINLTIEDLQYFENQIIENHNEFLHECEENILRRQFMDYLYFIIDEEFLKTKIIDEEYQVLKKFKEEFLTQKRDQKLNDLLGDV